MRKAILPLIGALLLIGAAVALGIGFRYRAEYASFDAVYEEAVREATSPDVSDPEGLFQDGGTGQGASGRDGGNDSGDMRHGTRDGDGTSSVTGSETASTEGRTASGGKKEAGTETETEGGHGTEASGQPGTDGTGGQPKAAGGQVPDSRMYGINWAALRAAAPGLVGWLRTGAGADYPVVQGADDSRYLHVDAYGNPSGDGAIFMWSKNDPAWRDRITFVYGHRMTTGTMFGTNYRYLDAAFAAANPYFFVYTEEGRFRYRVCAVSSTTSASPVYAGPPAGEDGMARWLETVRATSQVWLGGAGAGSRYVVLSTCTGPSGGSQRLLVVGALDAFLGYDGRDLDAQGAEALLSNK